MDFISRVIIVMKHFFFMNPLDKHFLSNVLATRKYIRETVIDVTHSNSGKTNFKNL